jgi:hypothetical protein
MNLSPTVIPPSPNKKLKNESVTAILLGASLSKHFMMSTDLSLKMGLNCCHGGAVCSLDVSPGGDEACAET